jgi:parallel beta-helix repeat protein
LGDTAKLNAEDSMNVGRRWAGVLLAALLVSLALPGAAYAAGRTVYVDDNGAPNAAGKGACGKPNYASVQAAVNDLTAARVVVCAGTYIELVTVERSLTLEGQSGAVIRAPAGDALAVVQFRGPQNSRLRGLTISGAGANVAAGVRTNGFVCEDTPCGPTVVSISNNRVSDIYSSGDFGVGGTGIFIFQSQANVEDNTVERYGARGISADGDDRADTFAQIDGNVIRGQGAGGPAAEQVGILVDETNVDMEDNVISGNHVSGDGDGVGIKVEFASGSIRDNRVTDNHTGIRLAPDGGSELRSNEALNNAANGIELFSTIGATIVENESSDNGGDGIFLADNTSGNTVRGNTAEDNGGTDIVGAIGAPVANTYTDNECDTSSPAGLCED